MNLTKYLNTAVWLSMTGLLSLLTLAPTMLGVEATVRADLSSAQDLAVINFFEVEPQPQPQLVQPENPLQLALEWSYYLESTWGKQLVGDDGRAIGPLHTWKIVVDDVNHIIGSKVFTYGDRKDLNKSCQMFLIYLSHYGKKYTQKTGQEPSVETYVRMWNGGPNGWRKEDTLDHWARVVNYNQ